MPLTWSIFLTRNLTRDLFAVTEYGRNGTCGEVTVQLTGIQRRVQLIKARSAHSIKSYTCQMCAYQGQLGCCFVTNSFGCTSQKLSFEKIQVDNFCRIVKGHAMHAYDMRYLCQEGYACDRVVFYVTIDMSVVISTDLDKMLYRWIVFVTYITFGNNRDHIPDPECRLILVTGSYLVL